jgi:hypothetical protein
VAKIYTAADIHGDPHYNSRGMIERTVMPDGEPLDVPGLSPGSAKRLAPRGGPGPLSERMSKRCWPRWGFTAKRWLTSENGESYRFPASNPLLSISAVGSYISIDAPDRSRHHGRRQIIAGLPRPTPFRRTDAVPSLADRSFAFLTLLLAAFALSEAVVRAQSTAQISGTVVDSSGGVLPGVTVTAIQTDTGFRREVVTDEMGLYTMPNLPIGPYRLEASLSGFRNYAQTGIVLQVNDNTTIPVTLPLGNLTETVAVEASAPLVETRNPSIGSVIDNERIEELPLNGRNAADLVVLAGAAVRPEGANGVSSSRSMQGGLGISVAGGQTWGVAYLLDGATHNNPYDNFNLPLPFPDALQEFRVETSAQNANNGFHSGASVNAATKAGTNTWHGDLFEFARNHRFNATNAFNAVDPATGQAPR